MDGIKPCKSHSALQPFKKEDKNAWKYSKAENSHREALKAKFLIPLGNRTQPVRLQGYSPFSTSHKFEFE